MMMPSLKPVVAKALLALGIVASPFAAAQARPIPGCEALPDHAALRAAVQAELKPGMDGTTGMGNQRWAAVVNRDGIVCAVVFSGPDRSAQWPGSRLIAAEKASTANALSGPNFALATGNLYYPSQPGQSLYGLATAAPPNPEAAFAGPAEAFGQPNDPLVGKPIGGIVVFGGGLPLYLSQGQIAGGLGIRGDTSCSDHVIAWRVRHALELDAVPAGVAPNATDNLILDLQGGSSVSGYGHPACKGGINSDEAIRKLPEQYPVGPKKQPKKGSGR
jgi:uncharacterized protein GlcG (DUF336 family)